MMRASFFAVLLAFFLLPGAAPAFWPLSEPPMAVPAPAPPPAEDEAAQLVARIRALARSLDSNLASVEADRVARDAGLVVCTFVDLRKLYRSSSFGRYLADQLMNEFQQMDYRVVEMRMSADVLIQEGHGEHGLSRDPARVRPEVASAAMLTGTYTLAPGRVLVNARLLDNRNGTVLASVTDDFPRTAMIESLLADASTARSGKPEVIYMKRLEL
ncbi:MAG: FlgO family outer membrane protein [Thermodesulfobacteriota bacterium]